MTYTEVKEKNKKKYYYRVRNIREGKKFKKKRIYLGKDLKKSDLKKAGEIADKSLLEHKNKREDKNLLGIKSKIIEILKKNKIKRAGIFGSYVQGEQKEGSDVDILVEISDKKMSLLGFAGIKVDLEEALRKKVDLVEYKMIRPELKKRIISEEVRIL
ncbi:nucleotidyltransferase family protein [Candidatus Pacearchaeota archaeon]|nr:nucleotidyltransferase family protein [Candidatus Pacearchaeota archaeon]